MILEVFPSGPFETNGILLGCPKTLKGVIIDVPFESADLLLKRAAELGLSIQMILLTHSHWDHIGEVSILKERLEVPVYVHSEDAGNLKDPGSDRLPVLYPITGVKPDHKLEDGQILGVGEIKIQVIHTPGHTPGGVCFYIESENTLISGDTLFRGATGSLSLPTAEPERMKESLKKLSKLPPETKVYPGHGEPTTIGEEF